MLHVSGQSRWQTLLVTVRAVVVIGTQLRRIGRRRTDFDSSLRGRDLAREARPWFAGETSARRIRRPLDKGGGESDLPNPLALPGPLTAPPLGDLPSPP